MTGELGSASPGEAGAGSVEQHGAGVLVIHLLHVAQDILLGDHAQQPPANTSKLA